MPSTHSGSTPPALTVDRRFCGPPDSGNGGYVCGCLAAALDAEPVVEVRLRLPPPLDRALEVRASDGRAELFDGDSLVAAAAPSAFGDDFAIPDAPSYAAAVESARGFSGHELHWFPGCFVCGPERAEGDGLRIFPGKLPGSDVVAGPWQPDESLADDAGAVRPEFLWAALDCAGAFAFDPDPERTLVLGSLTARLDASPRAGDRCIVIGWPLGVDGRKFGAGTAAFSEDGTLLGAARAVWIRIETASPT